MVVTTCEDRPTFAHFAVVNHFDVQHNTWLITSGSPLYCVCRSGTLSATQEASLQQLVHFLDAHLLPASHEKRGVALHVTTLLVQRCPAECLPVALSAVRNLCP
jgi:hypothetical protein